MDRVLATCSHCKRSQDVTAEAKKVGAELQPGTFAPFRWTCANCGTVNRGMIDAALAE